MNEMAEVWEGKTCNDYKTLLLPVPPFLPVPPHPSLSPFSPQIKTLIPKVSMSQKQKRPTPLDQPHEEEEEEVESSSEETSDDEEEEDHQPPSPLPPSSKTLPSNSRPESSSSSDSDSEPEPPAPCHRNALIPKVSMSQKQKRPTPLDQPHEEEEEESSSEETSDDEEEEDHQPPSPLPPSSKTLPSNSPPESSSSSDFDSDSQPEPPAPVGKNTRAKSLASKPVEQTPRARAQPSAAPARLGSKRPTENNEHVTDPKRSKKKEIAASAPSDEEDVKKPGDELKKLFQRVWSEEDEVAILEGMAEFTSKTGLDPFKQGDEFYYFIKKSLHVDASSTQLKQKMRRLKKKFENHAVKEKHGKTPKFFKAHDQKAFELWKKVSGDGGGGGVADGAVEKEKSDGKSAKSPKKKSSVRNVASPNKLKPKSKPESNMPLLDCKESGKMDIDRKPDETLIQREMIRFAKGVSMTGLNEDVVKRGLELIGAAKRAELEERWMKLQVAELELSAKRAQLVEDQARLILEAYNSSNC